MEVRINRRRWKIIESELPDGVLGMCVFSAPSVILRPKLRPQNRLGTLTHELLHAVHPDMSETEVARTEKIIAGVLWRDGWRRNPKTK